MVGCPASGRLLSRVLFISLLTLHWAEAHDGNEWDPARTWAFVVGVLEWKDSRTFSSFPQEGRRDKELVALLEERGVPKEQVSYITDGDATLERIEKELPAFLGKAKAGDSLLFYYCGHGYREDGKVYFANYDCGGKVGGWPAASIIDAVEASFPGGNALLLADCCYSGDLAEQARARGKRVAYGVLTSSSSRLPSTGAWTFTESILAGLRGGPLVDADHDGRVEIGELGRFMLDEMAFADGQRGTWYAGKGCDAGLVLARTQGALADGAGRRVEVKWKDDWWKARTLEARDGKTHVHYVGWPDSDDEWVGTDRMRDWSPKTYAAGTKLQVEWQKKWYPAKVLRVEGAFHLVHYEDYGADWDEWVAADRMKP